MKRQEHVTEIEDAAIRIRVESLKNGRYLATSPDVPGLAAEGRSISATVETAQGVARTLGNLAAGPETLFRTGGFQRPLAKELKRGHPPGLDSAECDGVRTQA